ncbi:hypothetical protein L1887_35810 [Cichorium endivia]|nr:hypothetical protein L1887_35810 [Cichorium endivia]
MEVRNSAAESHSSDQSQPIQETEGDDGSKMAGGPVDVLGAAGGDGGVEFELGNGSGGAELMKKKRGRPPRAQAKSPPTKMNKEEDEDVCFICFDGGSLVLCDRRGCPKAYHPACVKRDEAFFQSKNKWNCGWHICSICQKTAHHMCYTCTYSLCKGCIKKADYVCVRGDKGFCTVCMKTIMLIENNGQEKDEKARVDFDDKTSWEYLFKVYWVYLKGKLSLTLDELTQAKNPCKEATTSVNNGENDFKNITSDISHQNLESKRRKTDEHMIIPLKETVITKKPGTNESKEWATKELLEFVSHMKNGDTSILSQFDVQELMLEYIKRNNLRDPRKKSQIICDSRLKILFGKLRVGHFEMLKLLEFHFFINDDLSKNTIKGIGRQVDPDWNIENMVTMGKDKKRRNHKKSEDRVPQNKLDEYAAIDVHNMNLIYLRRKLMENLFGNNEEFHGKVVGSIVRIRISGSDQKHDMYRLVQVVGTSKTDAPYKIGNKSVDIVLEVLNLDKKETISIDTISNQDLSEGEIQDKAVSLQSVRLNDLMEAETLRLNNLRDRASEKGHKKGYPLIIFYIWILLFLSWNYLREYVEKLQRLKTPEERERRLREIPEVHSDPKMNPDYETDDTEDYFNKEHVQLMKPKHSKINHKTTNSPKKRPDFLNNGVNRIRKNEPPRHVTVKTEDGSTKTKAVHGSTSLVRPLTRVESNGSSINNENHRTTATSSSLNTLISNDTDMEKVWYYRDPSGKVQGPFCKIQLQKWSTTGYFPVDMKIWMKNEEESLLLNDVLNEELRNPVKKVGIGIESLTVRIVNPSELESTEPDLATPTPAETKTDHVSSVFDISNVELPSPTPKTMNEEEKVAGIGVSVNVVQDVRNRNMDSWSNGGGNGVEVLKTGGEWSGYSPTSGGGTVAEVGGGIGFRETIEFSTLAEESVSDLLAEVDAMESQNGIPSPTSRRNGFVEDLFNGSFEEFSPTPHQSPFQPTTTTTATTATATATMPFKWPDIPQETIPKDTIDVNNSTKTDGEKETNNQTPPPPPPPAPSPPPPLPPPSLAVRSEAMQGNFNNLGRPGQEMITRVNPQLNRGGNVGWDPHQWAYNTRERSYNFEDLGYNKNGKSPWGRPGSFVGGSGGGGGGGGGGYVRAPPKGKRVCKFYESGRCNKGASCNYWHP